MAEEIKTGVAVCHFQDFYPKREVPEGAGGGKRVLQPRQAFGIKAVQQDNPREFHYVEVNSIYLDLGLEDDQLIDKDSINKGMELAREAVPLGATVKFRVITHKGRRTRCFFLGIVD